jgi:Holliday junction DNA helicase RuvA
MLARLRGRLESLEEGTAIVGVAELSYEVLLTGNDAARLTTMVGEEVEFALLHYLESQANGAVMRPRLVGFASTADRAFFELFTSVKGIGYRKALRALQLPIATIARAIGEKDLDTLRSLPEIGKRTAETIVLELHDKVTIEDEMDSIVQDISSPGASRDAIQVLVQLGEPRIRAVELVDRAGRADPEIETADALVAAALRLKEV